MTSSASNGGISPKMLDRLIFALVLTAIFASTLGGWITFIPMTVGLVLGLLWGLM